VAAAAVLVPRDWAQATFTVLEQGKSA
jgi:hypothetical protein